MWPQGVQQLSQFSDDLTQVFTGHADQQVDGQVTGNGAIPVGAGLARDGGGTGTKQNGTFRCRSRFT